MGSLGWPEILMILVVALIIFGPRKLPELGKTIGQSLAQFRKASEDFKRTWEEEVEMEKRRIEAPPKPYEETYNAYNTDTGDSPPPGDGINGGETQNYWSDGENAEAADQAASQVEDKGIENQGEETAITAETIEVAPTVTADAQAVPRQAKRDWM